MSQVEAYTRYMKQIDQLKIERASFDAHWKDLGEFMAPRRTRFFVTDRNVGNKRHRSIINSRGLRALSIARNGLFAGIMSPARPWFMLETIDPDLNLWRPAQLWMHRATELINQIFHLSNLYNSAPTMLGDSLLFGTGCMVHDEDELDVARFYTQPIGSYFLAQDERRVINTFVGHFELTVEQMVSKFGLKRVSQAVKTQYDRSNYYKGFPVYWLIEPNRDGRPGSLNPRTRPFRSVWFEPGRPAKGSRDETMFLRESGYHEFPVYAVPWERTGEDVYGTNCPGMEALGDVSGAQVAERDKAKAVQKMVTPPMAGPPALKNVKVSHLPGGLTIYDGDGTNALRPVYQVDPRVQELRMDIREIEGRINEAFFVDLFMAISSMPGIQPKNQLELMHRDRERLQHLGPVLEQLHGGFLAPLVDRTFNQAVRSNLLPTPPVELQEQPLSVRFVSSLAMAQRAVELNRIEDYARFVGAIAGMRQDVVDMFDADEAADQYARLTSVIPSVVPDRRMVAMVRQQRAEQQQQMLEMQQMQAEATAASQGGAAIRQLAEAERTMEETA